MQNHRTGETPQMVYCIGTEKKQVGREGNGESVFNGWGLPVHEDGDRYWEQVPNSVEAFHATEPYTSKWLKW